MPCAQSDTPEAPTRDKVPFGDPMDVNYPKQLVAFQCRVATPFNVAQLHRMARNASRHITLYNGGLRSATEERRKQLWKCYGAANSALRRLERAVPAQ